MASRSFNRWLERERDEFAAADAPDRAGKMIQQLASLRGIGVKAQPCWFARPLYDTFPMARRSAHMPALLRLRIAAEESTASKASGRQVTDGSER